MFPHPDTVTRITEQRRREALAAAAQDRAVDGSRVRPAPRPEATITLRMALGAALVRIGERLGGPASAAIPGRMPAR